MTVLRRIQANRYAIYALHCITSASTALGWCENSALCPELGRDALPIASVNNDVDADSAVTLGWGDVDGPGRAPDVQHYGHVLRPGELGRDGGAQGEAAGRQLHHTTGQIKFIHISKN